jgi:hypothetical protein
MSFFECLVRDIPADARFQFFKDHPTLMAAVFEGFSAPAPDLNQRNELEV